MRIIKLYFVLLLCLYTGITEAKPYEKVILKNGSELEGYISLQRPGKEIIFAAEKATIYIPSNQLQSVKDYELSIDSLSAAWEEWVKNNPWAIKTQNGKEYLVLSDLVFSDNVTAGNDTLVVMDSLAYITEKTFRKNINWNVIPHKVRVLEKGSVLKYLDHSPNSYSLSWDEIQMIKRDKRAKLDLTGLIDVIELQSGEIYEGQIVEQIPNKQIRLLKEDGIVEVISAQQIAIQRKMKLNQEQELFEQAALLDVVRTKSGEETKGIITEQNYGMGKDPSYMLIQNRQGDIQKIKNSTVVEIRKEKNPLYNLISDVLIENNEILVNRKRTEPAIINEYESVMIINIISKVTVLDADSIDHKIIIETQDNPDNRGIILLKPTQLNVKKEGIRKAFTYEDLLTKGVLSTEVSVSTNGTLKLVYPISTKGDYILYKPKEKNAILLNIK